MYEFVGGIFAVGGVEGLSGSGEACTEPFADALEKEIHKYSVRVIAQVEFEPVRVKRWESATEDLDAPEGPLDRGIVGKMEGHLGGSCLGPVGWVVGKCVREGGRVGWDEGEGVGVCRGSYSEGKDGRRVVEGRGCGRVGGGS